MKIVIDGRFWGPSHTGLGVYTRELVLALSKIDVKNSYTLLIRRGMENEIDLPKNFNLVISEAKPYTFTEQFLLAWQLFILRPDIVHFPSINVPLLYFGKYIVTVHDVIKHLSRGKESTTLSPVVYWLKYGIYRVAEWIVVAKAKQVIVPSASVKAELARTYPLSRNKTVVTHEAAVLVPLNAVPKDISLSLPKSFAVYTGNAYPHKNLSRLITTWKEVYEKSGLALVISSGRSVFSSRIEALIKNNNAHDYVFFKGYLSDQELQTVYSKASLYVFPSLMEGFGMPALDAMAFSLPVVCSNIPVFKEIYGDAAEYFDPNVASSMVKSIVTVATDKTIRKLLITRGKARVANYSWQKTAEETLAVYNKAL